MMRKHIKRDDAVSPVIAVILMVAITVVLAATVYVWVSGFGSQSTSPANSLAITSAGALDSDGAAPDTYFYKQYVVASASPSLTYGDMRVTLAGAELSQDTEAAACTLTSDKPAALAEGKFMACAGTTTRATTATVQAGDIITIKVGDSSPVDDELVVVDELSNSVMVRLRIR